MSALVRAECWIALLVVCLSSVLVGHSPLGGFNLLEVLYCLFCFTRLAVLQCEGDGSFYGLQLSAFCFLLFCFVLRSAEFSGSLVEIWQALGEISSAFLSGCLLLAFLLHSGR